MRSMLLLLMIVGVRGGGFWVDLVVGLGGLGDRLEGRMRCGLASPRDSPRDEEWQHEWVWIGVVVILLDGGMGILWYGS